MCCCSRSCSELARPVRFQCEEALFSLLVAEQSKSDARYAIVLPSSRVFFYQCQHDLSSKLIWPSVGSPASGAEGSPRRQMQEGAASALRMIDFQSLWLRGDRARTPTIDYGRHRGDTPNLEGTTGKTPSHTESTPSSALHQNVSHNPILQQNQQHNLPAPRKSTPMVYPYVSLYPKGSQLYERWRSKLRKSG